MLMMMLLLVIMEDFLLGVADAATWEVMIRRSRQVVGIHVAEAVHGLARSIPDPSEKVALLQAASMIKGLLGFWVWMNTSTRHSSWSFTTSLKPWYKGRSWYPRYCSISQRIFGDSPALSPLDLWVVIEAIYN
jgi:hypothetical protein